MKLTEIKEYYVNGNLHRHYFVNENNIPQGEYRYWWSDGKLWEVSNWRNGNIFGISIQYKNNNIK